MAKELAFFLPSPRPLVIDAAMSKNCFRRSPPSRTRSKVPPEEYLKIKAELESGVAFTSVARRYGVTTAHISKLCRAHGWKPKPPQRKPKVPVEAYAKIQAELEQGETFTSIAGRYDVHARYISDLCRTHGWTRGKPVKHSPKPPAPKPPSKPPTEHAGWPRPWREQPTAESRIGAIVARVQADPQYVAAQLKHLGAGKRETNRKYSMKRRSKDHAFKLAMNLRSRLNRLLRKKSKSAYTMRLLGCSVDELIVHLESRFSPSMNWDNYGTLWHVDHIIPLASFDLSKPEHLRAACHWTNLQPLEASANIKKKHHVSDEVAADVENYVFLVNNVL